MIEYSEFIMQSLECLVIAGWIAGKWLALTYMMMVVRFLINELKRDRANDPTQNMIKFRKLPRSNGIDRRDK